MMRNTVFPAAAERADRRRQWPRHLVLLAAIVCLTAEASERGLSVQSRPVASPPVLDGVLDDIAWHDAEPIADFVQIDPVEGGAPSQRTEVRILHDADNLYIGVQLDDDRPETIVRNVMVRQPRLTGEDRFQVVLDTFHDGRNGYYFEVNANGLRADALIENNITLLDSWDGIWSAEARVHERGWSVEMRIPFKTLSFDPRADAWGINFYRSLAGRNETVAWNTARRVDAPFAPMYAGDVTGLSGLQPGAGIDVVPSLSLRRHENHQSGETENSLEPSLDVFYKVTQSTTAALTVNTDFSATEVDDREINLSRFSLFFPEKRLFFLQDAGIFEFGGIERNGRPFFSRTIGLGTDGEPVPLDGGVKITGREGRTNFGMLAVRQDDAGSLSARDLFVGRAQVNIFGESYIGGIATHGNPRGDERNHLGGIDFRFADSTFFDGDAAELSGWYQESSSEGMQGDDAAWRAQFRLPNDRWFVMLTRTVMEKNFNPAMGFVNRHDIRADETFVRFRARPDNSYWLAHNFSLYANRITDTQGRFQSSLIEINPWGPFSSTFDYYGPLWQSYHEVLDEPFTLFGRITIPAGDYRYQFGSLRIETAQARDLRVWTTIGSGEFYDGTRDMFSLDATWRAHPRVSLDLFWSWNDVSLPDGSFIAQVQRVKASVALSPRLAWITLAQHDNVSRELGLDMRLQWLPEAGREWYLILQHGAQRDANDDFVTVSNEAVIKIVHTLRF